MNALDTITLKAFLAALMRLNDSLPADLQNQLNEIAKALPADICKLHAIAKSYLPLAEEYIDARLALQHNGFRLNVPDADYSNQMRDEKIINFAVEVLNTEDSVNLAKQQAQESTVLGQLLFYLRCQTSFMVKNTQDIPEEEQWLWENPRAWASLERGLQQAAAGQGRYLGDFSEYADLEIDD